LRADDLSGERYSTALAAGFGDSADTALARSADVTLIAIGPMLVADSTNRGIDEPQNDLGPIA
jgi:hypothetical protein